jgi:hypothetical protein
VITSDVKRDASNKYKDDEDLNGKRRESERRFVIDEINCNESMRGHSSSKFDLGPSVKLFNCEKRKRKELIEVFQIPVKMFNFVNHGKCNNSREENENSSSSK